MPSTSEVVLGIIARSGLDPKAGYPLYAYRTSDDERAVLRSAVVGALKQAASGVGKLTAIEAAGFCLFAAEHFCRAHEGGTWSWEPIFNSLGTHLGPSTLYDLVIRGLGHWNRRVLESNHGRAFLVTLACEGGLPRALITQEGTRLRRYFEQLLSARECFQDTPAEELAQRLEEELPGSLRQDVVFGLSATLIDAVAHLRTLVGNASDPLRELDVKQPGWQTWIPLRLEDEVARDLLQGLMRQPRTSDSNPGTGVRLETRLLVDNGLRLIRKPVVPPDIAAATLAAQLRVTSDKLPSRLSLYLLWSDGTRQPLGSATRAFTQERFHTSGQVLCPPLSLETLLAPVRLGAVVGTHELQAVPLDGAELPPELPWVFTRTEDTAPYVLRGYGPVCTRAEEALVVLPSEASWRAEPPEAATELGTLERLGRRVVRLQGTLRVQHGEDSMTIRTRQPAEDIRTYAVRGELFTLGPWGSEVFRGAPRVFECREGGSQREVKAEWRPWDAAGEPWQPLGPNTIGSVALRVVQDREVCFRTRVDCLPRDAHCDIVPGKEDGEGELIFRDARVEDVGTTSPEVTLQRHVEGANMIVHLSAAHGHPRSVPLKLRFSQRRALSVNATFPARETCFVGRDDQPVDSLVALHRLGSIRARVFDPRLRGGCFLECQQQNRNWVVLTELPRREEGTFELSLDCVAEQLSVLLAASEGLDAQVCLRLVVNGRASPKRLPVARYDGNLDKGRENSEAVEIRLNESAIKALSQEERARLRLEARPLWNPKEPARLLRERPEGDWIFDLAGCAPGVWLLTAWIGTLSPLRPLRVTINGTAPAELKLERAIHAHPQAARHKQLGELVRELATEASHAEWPRLMDFLATMSSLPSPTYEVVRRVAGDPEAAVLALIKDKMSGVLWAGLEQLPFMWALVPAQVWVRAVRRELAWREKKAAELASEGIPVDPRAFLKPLFKEAPLRASWMHCILSLWSETLGGKPSAPSPFVHLARTEAGRRFLRQQLQPAQQELIRAHAEDPWPEVDFQRPDWMGLYREVPRECWLEPTQLFQTAVLRAPVVAAVASARDLSLPPERVLELRRLRAFDERWFDEAYGSTLACLLGSALQKNPELFK